MLEESSAVICFQYFLKITWQINVVYTDICQYVYVQAQRIAPEFFWKRRKLAQKHIFLEYPIPEIPDVFENKSSMDRVLQKIIGSGIGYPSDTACDGTPAEACFLYSY